MALSIKPAPVRKTLVIEASPEHAFDVFTRGFFRWWPKSHHIGKAEMKNAILEPRAGGRWYEIGVDGSECDWGKVLAWEPPNRLVLAWQIGAEWAYDADLITEIEARFSAEGEGTRLDFEHRYLERMGERGADVRTQIDGPSGWTGILAAFGEAAKL